MKDTGIVNVVSELDYNTYLCLDELLNLQKLKSEKKEHDEMLFIIVHQVYELWFKQIIEELSILKEYLYKYKDHKILLILKRIRYLLKVMVSQSDILETMGPVSFQSFRKYLGRSSGFQSFQFRVIEFLLGLKKEMYLDQPNFSQLQRDVLITLFKEKSIWTCFLDYFKSHIIVNDYLKILPDNIELNANHRLLMFIYLNPSIFTEMTELVIDIDEGLQEWRYRHVKMVERTIGPTKLGTAGSSGVEYLKKSLFKSFCPELLDIRNYL